MKRRIARGLARRGFLAGALAGGLAVVVARRRRGTARRGGSPPNPTGQGPGGARPAEPWAPLREDVISPDELVPSGRDLAG